MEEMKIFEAARQNDLQRVKFYVEEKGVSASVTNNRQKTIAHFAVQNDNLEMLKYILDKDPSLLQKTDNRDSTIFQLAVERGALDIVKYLVEKRGANILDRHVHDYNITGTAVHRAIKYGHLDILRYFIGERNVDVNVPVADQLEPLLFLAMEYQNVNIIKYLIQETKANLTALNSDEENILFVAAKQHNLNFMKDLLDRKTLSLDINWKRLDGKTLVHIAILEEQMATLQYLVEDKKANVNIGDIDGNTPLHCVLYKDDRGKQYDYYKYLIMHEASIYKQNKKSQSAEFLLYKKYNTRFPDEAIEKNDLNFLKYLLDVMKIDTGISVNPWEWSLLERAINRKFWNIAQYLVDEKHCVINSDITNNLDRSLFKALEHYNTNECKFLTRLGANLKREDEKNGNSPLHIAASKCYYGNDMCKYFVEHGSDINQENKKGESPLHLSASCGCQETCEFFLLQGARIDKKNYDYDTPLHYATLQGRDKICEYFIKSGANVNEKNKNGNTPLHLAMLHGRDKICEYFIKSGANVNETNNKEETPLHLAASQGKQKQCKYLITRGANINSKNKDGKTPLQLAFSNHHEKLFTYLADCNAEINDTQDEPIIHIAASKNLIIVLNYLVVKKNADVNAPRKIDNWTPLHCAAYEKKRESFQYLVNHGANINAKDTWGKTPLEVVTDKRFMNFMETVLKKRSRRSVVDFSAVSYPNSSPNRFTQLRISGNVDQGAESGLWDIGNFHATQFQNFLTLIQLIVGNFYKTVSTRSSEKQLNFSPRAILRDRMDPMAETSIKTPPKIKE